MIIKFFIQWKKELTVLRCGGRASGKGWSKMSDLSIFELLFFGIPILLVFLWVVSIILYVVEKRAARREPASDRSAILEKKRMFFIVMTIIVVILAAVVAGIAALLAMAVANM